MYDKFNMTSWTPGMEGKPQGPGNKVLLFLVVLFALATVALAVILAVTVLKVDKDNKESDTGSQVQNPITKQQQPPTPTPCPTVTTPEPAEDVCLTEGCVLAAARVRNSLDVSVNPCDDFYQFACGSWLKQNVIPEDKSSYGSFTQLSDAVTVKLKVLLEEENNPSEPEVIHKAKDYYKACVNEERIEQLGLDFILSYMEALGGWPVMGNNRGGKWDSTIYNLEDLMIRVRNETNTLPLVDIYVSQDDKNPTKYILTMDQTSLGMPSRDYLLKARNDSMIMAYQKMIRDIAIAFGADEAVAEQDTKEVVDFEIELANITMRREDRRDPEKLYNKMKVGDLSKNFTGLDWMKLAKGTFDYINLEIDETEPIVVVAPPYFEKLMDVVNKYPPRVIANYLVGNRVLGKTFYLPAKFTDIKLEYQKVLRGSATRSPRWRSCSNNAVDSMPQVVGRLFIEEHFKQGAKNDVLQLVDNLREAFKEMLTEVEWMEDTTKATAKDKADYVEPRIGYPDWVYNDTRLREKYELVTVYRDDPLKTLISFNKANVQKNLGKLRKDYDKSEWGMSAATVNAYYSPTSNQITFPAAILQPPFYTHDQPAYLNYGGIGYVIGHELTHGFDDQGRVYDKNGNLNSWWSDTDTTKFKAKAQCMIDQYSSYVVPGTGNMTINGITTQGENIADNGGLKESFRAYQKWVAAHGKEPKLPGLPYTASQLYFVNAAQIWCIRYRDNQKINVIRASYHPLQMYRVYGPLQNSEDFAQAFQCPAGSKMNPRHKCTVW